nr:hypothetical protein [Tanacetum cinerariifolium]
GNGGEKWNKLRGYEGFVSCSSRALTSLVPEGYNALCRFSPRGVKGVLGIGRFNPPRVIKETGKGPASESSAKKKGRTVVITTEDMQKRRNDVKARTTLFFALPNEHQLRFSKYETAKELWEAKGSETLKQTFNRLQAIVSHLEFIDVEIKQDDLNQKFLTSLALEWLMYTIVWKNIDDLDTMSLDDVYNHLKVYEIEVQKKSESISQNIAFISSSNTSSGKGKVHTASVPTASSQVSTASTDVETASISHDSIDEDDIEEIDIKWNMALLSMRADRFWKKTGKKITIQGSDVAGFDKSKSYMANEEENHALVADDKALTEFALMAKSSLSFENKVEARLVEFKTQEIKFCKKIKGLERDVEVRNNKIEYLMNELEQVKKEKEGLDNKLTGFESALKDLDTLLGSQRTDKNKKGLGYSAGNSQNNTDDKGYWDSGCSRHMTGNISYLSEYEPYDGGYVSLDKEEERLLDS